MKALLVKVFIFLFFAKLVSQQPYEVKEYQHQISLQHDNDFITLTDYYYSSGLFLTYTSTLKKGISQHHKEQISVGLAQEIYTPSQTKSTNSALFDRPYVGFTGAHVGWSASKNQHLVCLKLLAGIAGNNSGAGGFQRWYHKAVAIADSPIWIDELNNSFHTNMYASHIREWTLSQNPFGVRVAFVSEIAFGSRDIYVEPQTVISFGRRNKLSESIAFRRLGTNEREIYFALRCGYRHVFYNALLEGNLFGDASTAVRNSKASLLLLGFDFNHRFNKNDYTFGVRYNSSETTMAMAHRYIVLSYGLRF